MKSLSIVLLACCAEVATAAPAFAQGNVAGERNPGKEARRPYRGLFDRGAQDQQKLGSSLFLNADIYGTYDDNVAASTRQSPYTRGPKKAGYYSGVSSALEYQWLGSGSSFRADGGAGWRFYNTGIGTLPVYHESADFNTKLNSRTNVTVGQAFLYSETYQFNLFPGMGGIDIPDPGTEGELDLFSRTAYHHAMRTGVSETLGRHSTLRGSYGLRYVDFVDPKYPDYLNQYAGVDFDHRITAHATFQLGYTYRGAQNLGSAVPVAPVHNINIGVNYSRALSFSRSTTFSFSTGSGLISAQHATAAGAGTSTKFHIVGNAQLQHELGRSWTAALRYERGFVYREGYSEPFLRDGVSATLSGLISRKLDVSVVAQYADANLAVTDANGHKAFAANAQLRYALSPKLAASVRYFHYNYQFVTNDGAATFTSEPTSRNGIRVGISATLPVIR